MLLSIGTTWADTTPISCSGSVNSATANTTGLACTNCTLYWSGLQGGDNVVTVSSTNYYKMGSGSAYVQIKHSTVKFQAGDVLTATVTSNGGSSTKTVNIKVGSTNESGSVSVNSNETKNITYTLTAADIESDGSIKIYRGSSASSNLRVASFSVSGTRGDTTPCDLIITSSTSLVLAKGGTSTITHTTSSAGAVTYLSGSTSIATVSDAGVITAVAPGTTTITVSQAAAGSYAAGSATVRVVVPYDVTSAATYTIGSGTYGFSDNSNNYYFNNGFDMSNSGGKSYGSGSLSGSMKYSAGTTYTINIPDGITIKKATVTGRSNYGSDKAEAKWGTLFGEDYSDEVLPYSDEDPATKTITFATGKTGSIAFTPAGNQVQFIIVLEVQFVAQNNKFWDFSDWTTGSISTKFDDNLEIVGNSEIATNSSQTVGDESFTKRLKLNGTGSSSSRYIRIKVQPCTKISVYQYSGNVDRVLKVDAGSFGGTNLLSEGTTAYKKSTCYYTGAQETDIYIYSSNGNISIYGIKVEPGEVITPANDWSTYVTPTKLDFSGIAGLKAYRASAAAAGKVTLEEVGAVPANTPLLLIGTAATPYTIPVVASASNPGTNLLQAGDGTTEFDGNTFDYILFTDGKFYQIGEGTVATNKAYLHCEADPTVQTSRGLKLVFGSETTGIGDATRLKDKGQMKNDVFNLNGQRVKKAAKGLYIVNGKKYIK